MKKINLIVALLLIASSIFAQEEWVWANGSTGGTAEDFILDMKTDSEGNVYVAGNFVSSQITFGTNTLNNQGEWDAYLAKYNSAGEVQWAYNYGGSGAESISEIFIDNNDNIIITGDFTSSQIIIGTTTLTKKAESYQDMFVAKLDGDGTVIWANNYGNTISTTYDITTGVGGVAVDTDNNICVIGYFKGEQLDFGTQSVTNPSEFPTTNIFLVKFDADGNSIWAKSPQGLSNQTEYAFNLTTDNQNNVIIQGDFWEDGSSLDFGDGIVLNGTIAKNYFIAKYDTNGNIVWAKKGYSDDETCEARGRASIIADNTGNIYAHIYFQGDNFKFDDLTITSTCNGDDLNSLILKLDADGNKIWHEHFNSITYGNVLGSTWSGLAITPENELIVASTFNDDELTIDDITLINATTLFGAYTPFFVKFNQAGEAIWAETTVNNYHAGAVAVEIDVNGDLLVAGNHLLNSIFFDAHEQTNSGQWDGFVAKKTGIPVTETYSVTFNVTDDLEPEITLTGYGTQTATNGTTFFTDVTETPDPGIEFTAELANYETYVDNVIVDGDKIVNITLVPITTTYSVTFNITDDLEPEITLTGYGTQTATDGTTIFTDVAETPNPGIEFTAELANYETYVDNVIVDGNEIVNITLTLVDIQDIQNNNINIYPNPSNGIFTVTNPQGFKNLMGLEITDITGKIIFSKDVASNVSTKIDISNQPAGIYFIKINTETGIYTKKLIIQ